MKYLNEIKGFAWAVAGNNEEGYGKACVAGESFWLRDCVQLEDGDWMGTIDNELLFSDDHDLKLNDCVRFTIDKGDS